MTLQELKTRAETAGFKYAYDHFIEDVQPPHIIAHKINSDNFGADNKMYYKINNIQLELTTLKKDLELENKIETEILYDVFWESQETYIEEEKIYNVNYFFEIGGN
jgi:hypothetical protein